MKNFLLIILSITIFSCADNTSKKSEFQEGIVEMNDSKSQAMDNFTKAYLENNLEYRKEIIHRIFIGQARMIAGLWPKLFEEGSLEFFSDKQL